MESRGLSRCHRASVMAAVGLFVLIAVARSDAVELLKNPSFESGLTNWAHDGFNMAVATDDVHGGVVSVKCTGRSRKHLGPAQDITISPGKKYVFKAYIKLINDIPGQMYQTAMVKIRFTLRDGSKQYFPVCATSFIDSGSGWSLLGADFTAPQADWSQAHLYVEGLLPHTDFYFDDASLTEITDNVNWEQEANQRIEAIRKTDLHVNVQLPPGIKQEDVTVQIRHLKHSFGWGSVVRADLMVDPDFRQYQEVVYRMFNWATVQDYKWKYNRGNRTNPDYKTAIAATDVLNQHGLQVRGHCMFWAVAGHSPDWVDGLTATELKSEVQKRIAYITGETKGKLAHWDVNNELVHGHYFEQHTGDPHYTETMFQAVHQADGRPKLFLNDFSVVSRGSRTQSYLSQIQKFKAANVGLGGVGVQSHFKNSEEPNPTLINSRLDFLAQPGVPLFVTELDLMAPDDNTRADWMERVLRLYFAHPAVEGVILWGFWDHDQDPRKALVQGYGFQLNAVGRRFLSLTEHTWSTHVNTSLANGSSFHLRAFQGQLEAVVWHQGEPIHRQTVVLGNQSTTLDIQVDPNAGQIQLPTTSSPFDVIGIAHPEVNNAHLHTIGHVTSTSSNSALQCTTRWSRVSAVGNSEHVEVTCQGDEVLTGCSSLSENHDWHHDGEQISRSGGKAACRANNGFRSTGGVKAVARCCSMKGLECNYRTAGPSGAGVDDKVEVPCPSNSQPLGCSTFSHQSHYDGTIFTNTSCTAQNDDPTGGVYAYAACCSGPGLRCQTVTSPVGGMSRGDQVGVVCGQGAAMTGCNGFSQYGRLAGAFIGSASSTDSTPTCYAVNGADKHGLEEGVKAQATCCLV